MADQHIPAEHLQELRVQHIRASCDLLAKLNDIFKCMRRLVATTMDPEVQIISTMPASVAPGSSALSRPAKARPTPAQVQQSAANLNGLLTTNIGDRVRTINGWTSQMSLISRFSLRDGWMLIKTVQRSIGEEVATFLESVAPFWGGD